MEHWNKCNTNGHKTFWIWGACWPRTLPQNSVPSRPSAQGTKHPFLLRHNPTKHYQWFTETWTRPLLWYDCITCGVEHNIFMIFRNKSKGREGCATPTWEHDVPKTEKPRAAKWNVFTGAKMGHTMTSQGMLEQINIFFFFFLNCMK